MKRISLSREMVHAGNLILVNREHAICRSFPIEQLIPVDAFCNEVMLEQHVAIVLQKILMDLNCQNQIIPISGYRTEEEQTQIYETSLLNSGAEFTSKYVALPNHSEHQSGLAIDLGLMQPEIDFIRPHFSYTGICGAFRERSLQHGFIERYPKGKESITGIAHEPWHFRYVGTPHSIIMFEMGFTLEEYHLMLKEYQYGCRTFQYLYDGKKVALNYLAAESKENILEVNEHTHHTFSGNNMDGFVVTTFF